MTVYDHNSLPPWVSQAMRHWKDPSKVKRVKATPEGIDSYIDDLAARAPQEWQDALARIIAAPAPKATRKRR
jgi:hypothetical protein